MSLLFNIGLEVLATVIRQEIKDIQIGMEEVKLSLFAGNNIIYRKTKSLHQKALELINSVNFQDTRLIYRNLFLFYTQ